MDEVIGEGTANISGTVSFNPLISSLDKGSRAEGNAISLIDDLQVVIYNNKGFVDCISLTKDANSLEIFNPGGDNEGTNTGMPDNYDKNSQSEANTARATFKLTLPFGKYKMYVVANYGTTITEDLAPKPADLLALKAKWNNEKGEVSKNAQMFGCFSNDNQKNHDFDATAPDVIINKNNVELHAWIKRLASKLTIIYDGSLLKQGINVFIYKATICDIPKECQFGSDNKPQGDNNEINKDEILYPKGESLYYNRAGVVQSKPFDGTSEDFDYKNATFEYAVANWLEIDKSTEGGAVIKNKDGNVIDWHPETAQALYFYENCQGDYRDLPESDRKRYDKKQIKDELGHILEEGDEDWKDNVKYGTYVEVEGFYYADDGQYISSGPIKYRFMLGQDVDYNYNALRNRHYKLTLKFNGYANQADWHIEYEDEEPGLYTPEEYYMSYLYNVRQEMPIRLTGNATKVTMQIIENNWAPYYHPVNSPDTWVPDEDPGAVTAANNKLRFRWNKPVYDNAGGSYLYGLHDFTYYTNSNTCNIVNKFGPTANYVTTNVPYDPIVDLTNLGLDNEGKEITKPDWVRDQITPIWVGFLALQAPSGFESFNTPLPTGILNVSGSNYDNPATIRGLRNYYIGSGDKAETSADGTHIRDANTIPLYQVTYNVPGKNQLETVRWTDYTKDGNIATAGRNTFKAIRNTDESVTINVPLFTQPKDLGYISGFSGNNPYESYQRKAVVKVTAYFEGRSEPIVRYVPIYQVQRIINPKAIWKSWNTATSEFKVTLMVQNDPNGTEFEAFDSEGEWEAWVAAPNNDRLPLLGGTFTLSGGAGTRDGKIYGNDGSKVSFTIHFNGVGQNNSACGKIVVLYHGLRCEHQIFVRQGYNRPVVVGEDGDAQWSSFAVFKFDNTDVADGTIMKPTWASPGNWYTTWTFPGNQNNDGKINGLKAELTVNPMALGTMYKRGNYEEGIRIINNRDVSGPLEPLTKPLILTNGTEANWDDIYGIPYLGGGISVNGNWTNAYYNHWPTSYKDRANAWQWSEFEATVPEEGNSLTYMYDFPTLQDYAVLMREGFGVGVLYADGATTTKTTTSEAFGFFNEDNNVYTDPQGRGMRGFIVYNLKNYNQVFFPLGFSGMGRRTIAPAGSDSNGMLRYGAQNVVLDQENNLVNQYRPITYNILANPGVIYWAKKRINADKDDNHLAMDMNFFDLTFGPMDHAVNIPDFGDAIPIKPIVIGTVNQSSNKPARKSSKRRR